MSRLTRDGTAEPSRETKSSGANADREMVIFSVQLTTSRTGNLTRLIHTLAISVTIYTFDIIQQVRDIGLHLKVDDEQMADQTRK